jgi:hypothetical protein
MPSRAVVNCGLSVSSHPATELAGFLQRA